MPSLSCPPAFNVALLNATPDTIDTIDESHDIIHLQKDGHHIDIDLTTFLSQINGDVKLVVISSYINAVGIHGPSGDPVFLPLPKWGPGGNPNAKKKNKGSEGNEEEDEGEE